MMNTLLQLLIVLIVVGGILYIANVIPVDNAIKVIIRVAVIVIAAVYVIGILAPMVNAQTRYNPLEDFLRGMESRQGNSNVECNIQHRLDRRGDIRWIRIDCDSSRRWGRGR